MKIGLVVSGGMAKGAYEIGALKAIQEIVSYEAISCISTSSIGVLNGYAFATGKLEMAEDIWKNVCDNDTRLFVNQVLKGPILQQRIKDIYDREDELKSKFYCTLLNMEKRKVVYKKLNTDKDPIEDYLRASVSMPLYNKAVCIDDNYYYDGAMVDNIPVYPLVKEDLDLIICIYFDDINYVFENKSFNKKIIKITVPPKTMVKESVVIKRNSIYNMIEVGYDHTKKTLGYFFPDGYVDTNADVNIILDKIANYEEENSKAKTRITGDFLVSNMNRVVQKFTSKNIL